MPQRCFFFPSDSAVSLAALQISKHGRYIEFHPGVVGKGVLTHDSTLASFASKPHLHKASFYVAVRDLDYGIC